MKINYSAVEQFLSYADGNTPFTDVWNHPAYEIAREHANLFGIELSQTHVENAMANKQTPFSGAEDLDENKDQIIQLIEHIRANERDWSNQIESHLKRITPDEELVDVTLYLGIGYELGVGLQDGAYVNLNEPLFLKSPRQLLYMALHESSHVLYDRVHNFSEELEPEMLETHDGQRKFFNTLFHTEAFATFTPLHLRKEEGDAWDYNHPVCEDYHVVSEESQLGRFVEKYDAFRETLQEDSVSRRTLLNRTFGDDRLPYRVGCAFLDRIEEELSLDEVRETFYMSPDSFIEEYDWILDVYRTAG